MVLMAKLILSFILGSLLLTVTGNIRKLCRNRKLFFKVNINTVFLKLTFL
jgi:hypothetical protein